MRKTLLLALICLMAATTAAVAQVTFRIEAPRQTEVGDQIRVRYVANTTDVEDIHVGDFPGFEVVYGPSTSRSNSFSMVNGKTTHSSTMTFTYVLTATKEGTHKLPAATIQVNGKSIKSNTASIEVLPASGQGSRHGGSQGGQQAQSGRRDRGQASGGSTSIGPRDLYMTVTANKTRVYEQEAVLLTYKLYTLVDIQQIAGEIPQLDGFHVQELDSKQQMSLKYERVNGHNYGTAIWRQYVLFPQKSGRLKIPSVTFDTQVEVQNNTSMDPFDVFFGGGSLTQTVRKSITAPSCELEVMPLPTPKPESFTGAVGHFAISGSLTPQEIKANDAATLRLVVSGYGNMKLMSAPKVKFPQDFELYDPKETDKSTYTATGAKGNKIFDYVAVPRHSGTFHIPAVEFTYFDLESHSYKTLHTDSMTIAVAKGSGRAASTGSGQEDLKVLGNDIRYIKLGGVDAYQDSSLTFGSRAYWLAYPALLLVALGGLLLGRRITRGGEGHRKASKVASKRLRNAERLMRQGQANLFYEEVMRALLGYAADKLGIPMSELTRDNVAEAMAERHVPQDLVQEYVDVLGECEYARFAPGEPSAKMEKMYSEASDSISRLDAAIKKTN